MKRKSAGQLLFEAYRGLSGLDRILTMGDPIPYWDYEPPLAKAKWERAAKFAKARWGRRKAK